MSSVSDLKKKKRRKLAFCFLSLFRAQLKLYLWLLLLHMNVPMWLVPPWHHLAIRALWRQPAQPRVNCVRMPNRLCCQIRQEQRNHCQSRKQKMKMSTVLLKNSIPSGIFKKGFWCFSSVFDYMLSVNIQFHKNVFHVNLHINM